MSPEHTTASFSYLWAKYSLFATIRSPTMFLNGLTPEFSWPRHLFNNHPSEWFLLFKNSKSNSALHAYNTANDSDVIQSNQLRNSPSTTRSSSWNKYLKAPTRSLYVHDITLHEHIIINPSSPMDSAHHQLTVHIHIAYDHSHLRSSVEHYPHQR